MPTALISCCLLSCLSAVLYAAELVSTPLTTLLPLPGLPPNTRYLTVPLQVPPGSPQDLGAGLYVQDNSGVWFHQLHPEALSEGEHQLRFDLQFGPWQHDAGRMDWTPERWSRVRQWGVVLWSAQPAPGGVSLGQPLGEGERSPAPPDQRTFLHVETSGPAMVGALWEWRGRPQPLPERPYDPAQFRADAQITRPDGTQFSLPLYWHEPIALSATKNSESAVPSAPSNLRLRLRPDQAGTWHIQLTISRNGSNTWNTNLPPLDVAVGTAPATVQVDSKDPRFFALGEAHWWPVGINLRSVADSRSRTELQTTLTPNLGATSYRAYLARLGAAGCDAVEIWLSAWNLGLEGLSSVAGFHGLYDYNAGNAERLEQVLDAAWEQGIRVVLVLNHHGQASSRVDAEWDLNPLNRRNGGPLRNAQEVFTSPLAWATQEAQRRYILGRYGHHPAIAIWKLWTEVDLTDSGWETRHNNTNNAVLARWHQQAGAAWRKEDYYHRPVMAHWSTNYTYVDQGMASLKEIDTLGIDAYHDNGPRDDTLAELLLASITNRFRGLQQYKKPVLVTEYGGSPMGAPEPQLVAEHALSGWVALVSGHAGAPLLWWFEWVDQGDRFLPYRALRNFIAGEDLRDPRARSVPLRILNEARPLWARAWARPGKVLLYLLDPVWGKHGLNHDSYPECNVHITDTAQPGPVEIQWWNADDGTLVERRTWQHPGGPLVVRTPPFRRHLAGKLLRLDG